MKKILIFAAFLVASKLALGSCSFVQIKGNTSSCAGATTCAVPVTATGTTNHVLVVGMGVNVSASHQIVSVAGGGGTWVHCSNCHAEDANNNQVDISYNITPGSSATTITPTITSGSPGIFIAYVVELSCTGTPQLDSGASGSGTVATCTSCAMQNLTLNASDSVMQIITPNGSCSAAGSPYNTNIIKPTSGDGCAATADSQATCCSATWTTSSGTAAIAGIAFNDSGAASAHTTIPVVIGDEE